MDIVIHATKDGYRILYTTNEDLSFFIAKDMRSGANNDSSLGKSAYAMAFTASGTVYTKYTIVKDSQRSNALGNIAFSVFFNNDKSLSGEQIICLLEELSNEYSNKYIEVNI